MADRLRLLFLTQTYPRFDGDTAGPFIRDLARALVAGDDRVTVLTPHATEVPEAWDDDGVEVRSFRYAPEPMELVGYSRSLDADEKMKRGAMAVAPLYAWGASRALARELDRPVSNGEPPYDLVQAHWVVPNGLVASRFSRRIPVAVGIHGRDVFLAEKSGVRQAVRAALRRIRTVTGCSPELVDRVCALGFPTERSRVIPYGVDSEKFRPGEDRHGWREELGIPAAAPLLLSVGRMATKKGYQVLLEGLDELMARLPDLHLVLAGAGDRLDEFRRRSADHTERVHYPGVVLRGTLPDLYRAADAFVLPAVHDPKGNVDGLPNVILEGMASGLPVIATDVSGIPLAVRDGKNGRLVPEQDAAALVSAVVDVFSDMDRARALGQTGREQALSELGWATVAGRYRDAYELALGREA